MLWRVLQGMQNTQPPRRYYFKAAAEIINWLDELFQEPKPKIEEHRWGTYRITRGDSNDEDGHSLFDIINDLGITAYGTDPRIGGLRKEFLVSGLLSGPARTH